MQKLAYSVEEAAHLLGLRTRSVRYLMHTGRLGFVRLGRRRLIRHGDLEQLLRRHYVKAATPFDGEASIRPDTYAGRDLMKDKGR
jgi:excisionase family DNA binding protein